MDLPNNYKSIQSYDVRHLPIIKAFCDKLNIAGIIDAALDTRMEYSPGKVVVGLVQDTLAGRNPLCRVSDFFSHQDIELVVGKGMRLAAFSDDNIGKSAGPYIFLRHTEAF